MKFIIALFVCISALNEQIYAIENERLSASTDNEGYRNLHDAVEKATSNKQLTTALVDRVIQILRSSSPAGSLPTLDGKYQGEIMHSISELLQVEPYVESLQRQPGQSGEDYWNYFIDEVLDLFEGECDPLHQIGLYKLVNQYQNHGFSDGRISQLDSETLDWLERAIVCITIDQQVANLWFPYVEKFYNPIEMMENLERAQPVERDAKEIEFIDFITSQLKRNN